jgi:putative transposase
MHDNLRFDCQGFVVMPDHFHVLLVLGPGMTLESCMHVLCGYTSRQIALRRGEDTSIWQAGYWDHAIRSEDELLQQWAYLAENPVRKGFVHSTEAWPYFAFRPWPRSL